MTVRLEPLPPLAAIHALEVRGKRLAPTFAWQDVWQEEHAAMFTVAKSAGFDILTDISAALEAALKEGKTPRQFATELRPALEAKGWWGRKDVLDPQTGEFVSAQLGSTRRLQTIFDANMRVSYATGHWEQFERNKATRPWLRYVAVLDGRTRPAHAARHNLCLKVDDPYWDVWAPPCGWNCRCTLQSLSDRDVDRMRGQLKFEPPPTGYRDWTNARTGEVSRVPEGIDPGWAHNPGKAGHQAVAAADKLAAAPPELAAAAVADPAWPAEKLSDEFGAWFDQAAAGEPLERTRWPVGAVGRPVVDYLEKQGEPLDTGQVTVSQQVVQHMRRDAKAGRVPDELLKRMPEIIASPVAVLYDKRDPALLYVFDVPGAGQLGKLVVRVGYSERQRSSKGVRRQVKTNAVRSAGIVPRSALLNRAAYDLISGSL